MAKVEFYVCDPKALANGLCTPLQIMTYGDTNSPIVYDTETTFLECEAQNKSAEFMKWMVDFGNAKMKLADDVAEGDYHEIDCATAVGLAGQLTIKIGVSGLKRFLSMLEGKDNNLSPASNDDNSNEKSPDLPQPFDEV